MVDKNCHYKQLVTISGVTISGKHCIAKTNSSLPRTSNARPRRTHNGELLPKRIKSLVSHRQGENQVGTK